MIALVLAFYLPLCRMKKIILTLFIITGFLSHTIAATDTTFITPFERSKGLRTATYAEVTDFYKRLQKAYATISTGDVGPTDNGYPLRSVSYTKDGQFDQDELKNSGKLVILINNAIHP